MAQSQDKIGWRRFMEDMISRGVVEIPRDYLQLRGMAYKLDKWASGIVIKLLEVTHGQGLYRNVVVHDNTAGRLAVLHKEGILAEIEDQMAQGDEGLLEEHKYLLEVNLDSLDDSDGSTQEYWRMAIWAARTACAIISNGEIQEDLPRLRSQNVFHPLDGQDYG
jgi:hypothetical protein